MVALLFRRAALTGALLLFAGTLVARPAAAQIIETRDSSSNPMVEVFKSTIYGGLAGLLLGSALALAIESDDGGDTVKWSFVGGTFFGFGYGVYHVSTRPQPRAMLEHDADGWALAWPAVELASAKPVRSVSGAPLSVDPASVTARITLASTGF